LTPERVPRLESERGVEPRKAYEVRGRTYTVRSSEIGTLTELGKFRAVSSEDLEEFRYHGDEDRMRPDVANLIGRASLLRRPFRIPTPALAGC
jgi:hypothetical protein